VIKEFEKALREIVIEHKEPQLLSASRLLSTTPPFPTSKKLLEAKKTVFNYAACGNDFEYDFAKFLDNAGDVKAFAKIPDQFGFCIQYTDTIANIRNYFPDFVAVAEDGTKWIVETKGREDIEVKLKDNAAISWCDSATQLTTENWKYLKVPQKEFQELHPESFEELLTGIHYQGDLFKKTLSSEINKNIMGAEVLISTISAAMQAIELWLTLRDRKKASAAIEQAASIRQLPQVIEEARNLAMLIPSDILDTLSNRVDQCFKKYKVVLTDGQYLPAEIDEATEAVKACICRELRRIKSINGGIPIGVLNEYWNQYKCEIN